MNLSSWVDTHPWLSAGGAFLCCIVFAGAAHYLHPNSWMNFFDWAWAAISLLAFLGLTLNALSDYFSNREG